VNLHLLRRSVIGATDCGVRGPAGGAPIRDVDTDLVGHPVSEDGCRRGESSATSASQRTSAVRCVSPGVQPDRVKLKSQHRTKSGAHTVVEPPPTSGRDQRPRRRRVLRAAQMPRPRRATALAQIAVAACVATSASKSIRHVVGLTLKGLGMRRPRSRRCPLPPSRPRYPRGVRLPEHRFTARHHMDACGDPDRPLTKASPYSQSPEGSVVSMAK
jgi:hypothetical protein